MPLHEHDLILYSGSGGPLGRAVKKIFNLTEKSIGFNSKDCNLLDKNLTNNYFKEIINQHSASDISYLHIAAVSGGSHLSEKIPATLFVDNIEMAINSLNACRDFGINRVILILSTSCYSGLLENPSEKSIHQFPIETAEYGYSYAKRMFEVLMRAYNKQFGMSISCALVNGIIGEGMNFDPEKSILPAALIKKFVDNIDTDSEIELWGDGMPIREYTSSQDLARALAWCLKHQEINTLLNIGNTQKVSVKELAFLIADQIGINHDRIKFNGVKSAGKKIQATDNTNFVKASHFKYENILTAVNDAIPSYLNNRENLS
jgi:GDP-L-fucose synthase